MDKTIFVTGATGNLGVSLVSALRRTGKYRILCLVRPDICLSAQARLDKFSSPPSSNLIALEGNIEEENLGLKVRDIRLLYRNVDLILHAAASIRFDKSYQDIKRTNVDGTRNVLLMAKKIHCPAFHHISTAYVSGDAKTFNEDDIEIGQNFRNTYEKTKLEAEKLVRSFMREAFTIYRPSIIIGDSQNGHTYSFDGFYGYLKIFWKIKAKILENKKIKQAVSKKNEGELHLPIKILGDPTITLNLVPVDWVVRQVTMLLEDTPRGMTYHLVDEKPVQLGWLVHNSLDLIGINGIKLTPFCESQLEKYKQINVASKIYKDYLLKESKFSLGNLKATLGGQYTPAPEISYILLKKLIHYAIKKNFGTVPPMSGCQ